MNWYTWLEYNPLTEVMIGLGVCLVVILLALVVRKLDPQQEIDEPFHWMGKGEPYEL